VTTEDIIIVWLWLIVTGTGVVLTLLMMILTHSDLQFIHSVGQNGDLEATTKLAFWQEFRRFFVKVFLFAVGVGSFFAPAAPDFCRTPRNVESWVFIACLFGVVLLLDYSTIATMRYRRRFMQAGRRQ
jgi:uncharacterized membrane protein